MAQEETEIYEDTKGSLLRIQDFDVNTLSRSAKLGESFSFNETVEPARELINLYKRLSISALEDFPEDTLRKIKKVLMVLIIYFRRC